jgi:hypothetical protein
MFVAVYILFTVCAPNCSVGPEGACDVSSAGSVSGSVNSVELTVRRVRLKNSRSRSGATGDHYGENG